MRYLFRGIQYMWHDLCCWYLNTFHYEDMVRSLYDQIQPPPTYGITEEGKSALDALNAAVSAGKITLSAHGIYEPVESYVPLSTMDDVQWQSALIRLSNAYRHPYAPIDSLSNSYLASVEDEAYISESDTNDGEKIGV